MQLFSHSRFVNDYGFYEIYATNCLMSDKPPKPIVTPAQIRAARALLYWSTADLAERSLVSRQTIAGIESGKRTSSYDRTLADIIRACDDAGVLFIDEADGLGAGVRMAFPMVEFTFKKPANPG
jgi:DNA-binding XRE family transcriptional regulator